MKIYQVFMIPIFLSVNATAMQQKEKTATEPINSINTGLSVVRIELKSLLDIGRECYKHLYDCEHDRRLKEILKELKKHPEKNFADFWTERREKLIGVAKAMARRSPAFTCLCRAVNAEVNYELIKTFDKNSKKLIKKLSEVTVESNIST